MNRNDPATPCTTMVDNKGLTKREKCAMHFMSEMLINEPKEPRSDAKTRMIAKAAIIAADLLFDELDGG